MYLTIAGAGLSNICMYSPAREMVWTREYEEEEEEKVEEEEEEETEIDGEQNIKWVSETMAEKTDSDTLNLLTLLS